MAEENASTELAGVRQEEPTCWQDDDEYEVCVGRLCFAQPHRLYVPPVFYKRMPGREYRWKLGAKIMNGHGLRLKVQRALALPNSLGLGNDGRWRWQWYPLSLVLGMRMDTCVQFSPSCQESQWTLNSKLGSPQTTPYARLKAMAPLCGKLALRPVVELLPVPVLSIRRSVTVGSAKLTVRGCLELDSSAGVVKGPRWTMQLDWQPADAVSAEWARVAMQPVQDSLTIQYSRGFNITADCIAVATGVAEAPSNVLAGGLARLGSSLPIRVKLDSVKVSQIFGTRARRQTPASVSTYLKASTSIGSRDVITVVPGHWIDPGYEAGAPGEREFNLEVANVLERQLRGNGWEVLRPDRDAPNLSWEEYINWVSKQTLKGTPVLEIHGQGSSADYRGFVLGVIGNADAPLSKELAGDFGLFQMDWRDLAVPRRGGIILESFNSDEVLQMAPWHRTWAVRRLVNRIVACIERASSRNRASRGIHVDFNQEEDLLKLDAMASRRDQFHSSSHRSAIGLGLVS